jgi:hypothetical protein
MGWMRLPSGLRSRPAARATLDYDPEFGSTSGPWTTDMFVEAAYKSLLLLR